MLNDKAVAEAVLAESQQAVQVLRRLISKLEIFVDIAEHELTSYEEIQKGNGDHA